MHKTIITLCLCAMVFNSARGQNSQDDYTPPSSSAFSNETPSLTHEREELTKNILQLNTSALLRGNYFITYERALSQQFSVTGGIGGYFMVDIVGYTGSYNAFGSSDVVDYATMLDQGNFELSQPNIQFGFSGKWFLDDDVEDRMFLELGIRFYNAKYINSDYGKSASYTHLIKEFNEDNQQLFLNYGAQWINGKGKLHFCHQFYVGGGMRRITVDNFEDHFSNNDYSNDYSNDYILTGNTVSWFAPSLMLGYKIGFGW